MRSITAALVNTNAPSKVNTDWIYSVRAPRPDAFLFLHRDRHRTHVSSLVPRACFDRVTPGSGLLRIPRIAVRRVSIGGFQDPVDIDGNLRYSHIVGCGNVYRHVAAYGRSVR